MAFPWSRICGGVLLWRFCGGVLCCVSAVVFYGGMHTVRHTTKAHHRVQTTEKTLRGHCKGTPPTEGPPQRHTTDGTKEGTQEGIQQLAHRRAHGKTRRSAHKWAPGWAQWQVAKIHKTQLELCARQAHALALGASPAPVTRGRRGMGFSAEAKAYRGEGAGRPWAAGWVFSTEPLACGRKTLPRSATVKQNSFHDLPRKFVLDSNTTQVGPAWPPKLPSWNFGKEQTPQNH